MGHTLTEENIQKLRDELDYRITVKRNEIAREKLIAAEHGDRSENAEYKEACERFNANDDRIQQLMTIISTATVIDDNNTDKTKLGINTKARIKFIEDGDEDIITLVTTMDADVKKMHISIEADLGKALYGKRTGDVVEVNALSGKYSVEVLEIL